MEIRVLLFVEEGRARQKYLEALSGCGARVFVTSSYSDLSEEICNQTYHGVLLDLPTKMKAIKDDKAYVYRLVEKFPVAHLQVDEKSGDVRCFHAQQKSRGTLFDFIDNQCRMFRPSKIRADARKEIFLPVLIYKYREDKRPERSITRDISSGGCFIFSTRRWKTGHFIWIQVKDLSDTSLIHAQIRAVVKWGETRQVPGIGVQFIDLSQSQAEELAHGRFLETAASFSALASDSDEASAGVKSVRKKRV
jgi:hypothetical protein